MPADLLAEGILLDNASKLIVKAASCRRLAQTVDDEPARKALLELAAEYEEKAEEERRLIRSAAEQP
jgi:hypothetical protein